MTKAITYFLGTMLAALGFGLSFHLFLIDLHAFSTAAFLVGTAGTVLVSYGGYRQGLEESSWE